MPQYHARQYVCRMKAVYKKQTKRRNKCDKSYYTDSYGGTGGVVEYTLPYERALLARGWSKHSVQTHMQEIEENKINPERFTHRNLYQRCTHDQTRWRQAKQRSIQRTYQRAVKREKR